MRSSLYILDAEVISSPKSATKSMHAATHNSVSLNTKNGSIGLSTSTTSTDNLWHTRYGHLNQRAMEEMAKKNLVKGFNYSGSKLEVCEPCINGKNHRQPFPKHSHHRAEDPLALVHSDLSGKLTFQKLVILVIRLLVGFPYQLVGFSYFRP